jgi:hypothetical protein
LQWRTPGVSGAAVPASGPGSRLWSIIWLVMAEAFLFLFRSGEEKE